MKRALDGEVHFVLLHSLQGRDDVDASRIRTRLLPMARDAAAQEIARRLAVREVCAAFGAVGIKALVVKGSALAYTHYPQPWIRPRCDTDILIAPESIDEAFEALRRCGFAPRNSVNRSQVHSQRTFRRVQGVASETVDLHWEISNRPYFASKFNFSDLWRRSVPVAAYGDWARCPGAVDALLIACMHRVAHHNSSVKQLWFYDIRLIAEGLKPSEWAEFWTAASAKGIASVCQQGIEMTRSCTGLLLSSDAQHGLSAPKDRSATYMQGEDHGIVGVARDVRDSRGVVQKLLLVAEHLFPDLKYMRTASGAETTIGVAIAYVLRICGAAWKKDPQLEDRG